MFTLIEFYQQKACIQGIFETSFHLSNCWSLFSSIQKAVQPYHTTITNTVIINMYVYIHIQTCNFWFMCKMTEWNFIFKLQIWT